MTVRVIENLDDLAASDNDVIFFSRYRAGIVDNGGARRIAQLLELFEDHDFDFVTSIRQEPEKVFPSTGQKEKRLYLESLVSALIRGRHRRLSSQFGRWVFFSRRVASRWVTALKKRKNFRLVVVDDPIFFAPLIHYLHGRNIPIIAHCHNIETLSRGQVVPEHQLDLLHDELKLLAKCRACITISREETFLLQNLGMNPLYFPYHPPASIRRRLLDVRSLRGGTEKKDYLLLGSAGNEPTRLGMERIISFWGENHYGSKGDRLIVAGFGTEQFSGKEVDGSVEILGGVSDVRLDEILTSVRGCLVFQENGAGALTRISELLYAGVPVIANSHAARSYYSLPGVLELSGIEQLSSQLTEFENTVLKLPPLPLLQDPSLSGSVVETVFCPGDGDR